MRILITRPQPDADRLITQLNQAGHVAWHLPLMTFNAGQGLPTLVHKLTLLQPGDLIFVVSKQVMKYAHPYLQQQQSSWPVQPDWFAIGQATAQIVSQATGFAVTVPAKPETSESLLALPALQKIEGKRALILTGNGGRTLLADTLKTRGAAVNICECYQRTFCHYDSKEESNYWRSKNINVLVVTSGEALKRLLLLFLPADRQAWLLRCQLIVISQRLADLARKLGWQRILVADGADNDAILRLLLNT